MKYGSLILEKKEYVYLKRILSNSGYVVDYEIQKSLLKLSDELKTAHILDEEEMPKDAVRFNSIVTVTSAEGWEKSIQIVRPSERDVKNNKISILTPMGAALFGYSVDDTVVWDFPTGIKELKITEVAQETHNKNFDILI
ncbi:GreA/GreB family elongation factor [Flavobacteriaceae bacterium LMO-SS05]|jgi:regulator of nucleoside diphosphate kinase